jgi:hypothetical protein
MIPPVPPEAGSILQPWVTRMPSVRHQGVLLASVRNCDVSPKPLRAIDETIDRHLTAYLRWTFLVPADERELDVPGAFIRRDPPPPGRWKASELGHLPLHWYSHLMHAFQIVGIHHPDIDVRVVCTSIYTEMVRSLHLNPEYPGTMLVRLTEDRIAAGTVVS